MTIKVMNSIGKHDTEHKTMKIQTYTHAFIIRKLHNYYILFLSLYFHGFMLCFMLASTVHNLDCYFTSIYLWLCILFLLIVNLLLTLGFILIMCICSFLPSVSSIFVCRSFLLIYSIRLRLSLQLLLSSLNFFSLVTCFLVMNALFNCFVLCLLHLLLPLPPCFLLLFFFLSFFLVGILSYFLLCMLLWLL